MQVLFLFFWLHSDGSPLPLQWYTVTDYWCHRRPLMACYVLCMALGIVGKKGLLLRVECMYLTFQGNHTHYVNLLLDFYKRPQPFAKEDMIMYKSLDPLRPRRQTSEGKLVQTVYFFSLVFNNHSYDPPQTKHRLDTVLRSPQPCLMSLVSMATT